MAKECAVPYTPEITGSGPSSDVPRGGDSEVQELFSLLADFCSSGKLRDLLRAYRPTDRDYPISVNRDELKRSVQRLFGTGHIRREKLEEVLERAEENGRQHIYLYTPTTKAVHGKLSDFDQVERGLLEGKTRAQAGLPRFQIHPTGVAVADLRREEREGTGYRTWTFKMYAGAERWEQVGKPELRGDEKIVRYRLNYRREVILVKWHSFGLLELRIPTGRSKVQLQAVRDKLLRTLNEKLDLEANSGTSNDSVSDTVKALAEDFSPRHPRVSDLEIHPPGLQALVPLAIPVSKLDQDARSKDVKWISVNSSDFDIDGRTMSVGADDDAEDIYESAVLLAALKPVKDCKRLGAIIHLREQADLTEKLPVEFCPSFRNEIRVGSQTTPEAIEFIIRRVWERAKNDDLPPSPVDTFGSERDSSPLLKVDFSDLARQYPYLANALHRIQQWVGDNQSVDYLDPDRLQKSLGRGIPATDLAAAVAKMVQDGVLERSYRVRPAHRRKYIPQVFGSVDELLDADVRDDKGEPVDLNDADVVPVYRKAER